MQLRTEEDSISQKTYKNTAHIVVSFVLINVLLTACATHQKPKSASWNIPPTEYIAPDKPLINPNNDPFAIQ